MTLYVLFDDDQTGDSATLIGVFSSESAALEFLPRAEKVLGRKVYYPVIYTETLDAPSANPRDPKVF